MTKICSTCKREKDIDAFYNNRSRKDGKASICKLCCSTRQKNDMKRKARMKNAHSNNKDEINAKHRLHYANNKEAYRIRQRKYERERAHTNADFKIRKLLRSRLWKALNTTTKSKSTMELLGCSIEQLKVHLQQTAINNGYDDFNIDSYVGLEYHIDHIKPCSSFNLENEEEQQNCFHYSNLQILTAEKNLAKSDKVTFDQE